MQGVDRTLVAALAEVLDSDNRLTPEDAARRVAIRNQEAGIPDLEPRLSDLAKAFERRGVLNPIWLRDQDIIPYFFLVTGRAGHLNQVVDDAKTPRDGVSQYLLYGNWDSMLILSGSESEAERVVERLEAGAYEEATRFNAQDMLLCYRHRVVRPGRIRITDAEVINSVVLGYDHEDCRPIRSALLESGQLLGGTWTFEDTSPYPVEAWVGITFSRGRRQMESATILELLQSREELRRCLVHLFTVETGQPYHLFAKLACTSLGELNEAVTAIGAARQDGVRFGSSTYVVADGSDRYPLIRRPDLLSVPIVPDIAGVHRSAEHVFANLDADARAAFNRLPDARQVVVLRALVGLLDSVKHLDGNEDFTNTVIVAVDSFAREATRPEIGPRLRAVVDQVAAAVVDLTADLLTKVALAAGAPVPVPDDVVGHPPVGWEQRLPQLVAALREAVEAARRHQHLLVDPTALVDRLERFVVLRDGWQGRGEIPDVQAVDDTYQGLSRAIDLGSALVEILLASEGTPSPNVGAGDEPASGRPSSRIFISHAGVDNVLAERVAKRLRTAGFASWYSEWELNPGDSIVDRIQRALNQADVLIVMLSEASVRSRWVAKELNSTLMRQLDGSDVQVIPLRLDDAPIPRLLSDLKWVDLRGDFEPAFRSLLDALRRPTSP